MQAIVNHDAAPPRSIVVGSRCSELALCQTNIVIDKLTKLNPEITFSVLKMKTKGDLVLDKALSKIGGKSLFTKELEIALDNKTVDFVVHSLKDLPTTLPPGLAVGAVLERDDPRDCVVLHKKYSDIKRLDLLPEGSVIGTSSLRRVAQLSRRFPHLSFENIRGNLNTRLRKLDEGNVYDGICLAAAGIDRLNWRHRVNIWLEKPEMLYAISQGAMAVECRDNDYSTIKLLSQIHDTQTALRITAERTLMKALDGGCSVPIGCWSVIEPHKITLSGAVFSVDGSEMLFAECESYLPQIDPITKPNHHEILDILHQNYNLSTHIPHGPEDLLTEEVLIHRTGTACRHEQVRLFDECESVGRTIAKRLLAQGAKDVLDRARALGITNINEAPIKMAKSEVPSSSSDVPTSSLVSINGDESIKSSPSKRSLEDSENSPSKKLAVSAES